jgi:hypothetical protein
MVYFHAKNTKIWVKFGGPWNGKGWYIIWPFGIYSSHLEYILAIRNILWPFGNLVVIWYIFPIMENCVKKNLATLLLHMYIFKISRDLKKMGSSKI